MTRNPLVFAALLRHRTLGHDVEVGGAVQRLWVLLDMMHGTAVQDDKGLWISGHADQGLEASAPRCPSRLSVRYSILQCRAVRRVRKKVEDGVLEDQGSKNGGRVMMRPEA